MPVTALLDALGAHLGTALGAGTSVGVAHPAVAADLPRVSLSLPEVSRSLPGVGGRPAPVRTGALRVERQLDLADPVLVLDGEQVALVSADRRTLHLPHGPVVRADGTAAAPFSTADLRVRVGAAELAPVTGDPGPGQLRLDHQTGQVVLGAPLPTTGILELGYFVGQWEVQAERFAGALLVETFAASVGETEALSNAVAAALQRFGAVAGLRRLDPAAVGAVDAASPAAARVRALSYRFDFEQEDVVLPTGGGPIQRVEAVLDQARQTSPEGPPEIDPAAREVLTVR